MKRKTLIVCEKPAAAERIAYALAHGKPVKEKSRGVTYYRLENPDEEIVVCSALGHLYEVAQKDNANRREYPVWDYAWKPKHMSNRESSKCKNYIEVIANLSRNVDMIVNACDYDVEGSVIGYTIIKYACEAVQASRMKFSTLTDQELREAYKNRSPTLDYPLIHAGMCRHEVDWLYGINLSRALTESARNVSGRYATLSTGRVQGPTLKFIVEREKDILTHVPTPYWEAYLKVEIGGVKLKAEYPGKIESAYMAEEIQRRCEKAEGVVRNVRKTLAKTPPPPPFDIASLQSEAYRRFRYPPKLTLNVAERLYLDALISYPRTGSQKLPPSIGYREILEKLKDSKYGEYVAKLEEPLKPVEGPKSDPAHPAIYPTGHHPTQPLPTYEEKIYDLIVRRFLSTFARPSLKEFLKAEIDVEGYSFHLRGLRVLEPGWTEIYPQLDAEGQSIAFIEEGMKVKVLQCVVELKYTQPPPRFNPGSLLKKMEKEGIGTKATRADIIDTLYSRGYVEAEQMKATILAQKVIDLLTRYCPEIVDVDLTRSLEDQMQKIELGLKTREEVVYQSTVNLRNALLKLKLEEENVGTQLTEALKRMKAENEALNTPCPSCGASLKVIKSRSTGKRFIGCLNRCGFTLPLPQTGKLTLTDKKCSECGFQMVQIKFTRRRPLSTCPNCYVKRLSQGGSASKVKTD